MLLKSVAAAASGVRFCLSRFEGRPHTLYQALWHSEGLDDIFRHERLMILPCCMMVSRSFLVVVMMVLGSRASGDFQWLKQLKT